MNNALMRFIDNHPKGKVYAGKIAEIIPILSDWLAYTVNTFPHYTRHTEKHSEQILDQLSLLLFPNSAAPKPKPVVKLSAVEGYILVCAAYLHDAGMVISDKDKREVLDSAEWKKWISEGEGAGRYKVLQESKAKSDFVSSDEKSLFSYNIELRQLIAEFIRRQHHFRSGTLVTLSSQKMGGFDFDDPSLRKTIADVCIAHGLDVSDLNDKDRFPEIRTIRGEQVNVKFLSIIFRLGDLLDMGCDRACPSLMAAANPIPAVSKPHWDQYRNIIHRVICPDLIEVTANCKNQEEHRTLQNWCSWIESECKNAAFVVPRMSLHKQWQVPNVKIDITPASDASYIAEDWRFIFDEEKIIRRLIQDIHPHGLGFLHELIQNALDATRCRMYEDLKADNKPTPVNPWQISEEIRQKYPLNISILKEKRFNDFSQKDEEVLVVIVDDNGIGMSKEIIKNYFLQIGRSYYTSADFSEHYAFQPLSRFGVGFLSVFSHSNNVEVETYKKDASPLKMKLDGPRNFLLLENSERTKLGTQVKVFLDNADLQNGLSEYIRNICSFVEFPIYLNEDGNTEMILSESAKDFCFEIEDVTNAGCKFVLKNFPVTTDYLHGSLYVLSYQSPLGEDWSRMSYAKYTYPKSSPTTNLPTFPGDLLTLNGIGENIFHSYRHDNKITRLDVRGKVGKLSLDKERVLSLDRKFMHGRVPAWIDEIDDLWIGILQNHINEFASTKSVLEKWQYLQNLPAEFPLTNFWLELPETVRIYRDESEVFLSIKELQELNEFQTFWDFRESQKQVNLPNLSGYWFDIKNEHSAFFRGAIFSNMSPVQVQYDEEWLNIRWNKMENSKYTPLLNLIRKYCFWGRDHVIYICSYEPKINYAVSIFSTLHSYRSANILNAGHPFIEWLIEFAESYKSTIQHCPSLERAVEGLFKYHLDETLIRSASFKKKEFKSFKSYIEILQNMPGFPPIKKAPLDSIEKSDKALEEISRKKYMEEAHKYRTKR